MNSIQKRYLSFLLLLFFIISPVINAQATATPKLNINSFSGDVFEGFNGKIIKATTNNVKYFVLDGKKCLVPDETTFKNLFIGNEIYELPILFINSIPSGTPLTKDSLLIVAGSEHPVYLLTWGKKHWIQTPAIFEYCNFNWTKIVLYPQVIVDSIPTGKTINFPIS